MITIPPDLPQELEAYRSAFELSMVGAGQEKPWIRISFSEDQNQIQILVTDSGTGIQPALRDKLFQPFFTTKEIGRGTGLGLSVAKGLVETHSGSLHIDPDCPNTRFVIALPKRQQANH
jgi:signal transduction histidine kinase